MADLQRAAQQKRFGSVVEIRGADFVREVTHAGPEVWVVLHLYKDGCVAQQPIPSGVTCGPRQQHRTCSLTSTLCWR